MWLMGLELDLIPRLAKELQRQSTAEEGVRSRPHMVPFSRIDNPNKVSVSIREESSSVNAKTRIVLNRCDRQMPLRQHLREAGTGGQSRHSVLAASNLRMCAGRLRSSPKLTVNTKTMHPGSNSLHQLDWLLTAVENRCAARVICDVS